MRSILIAFCALTISLFSVVAPMFAQGQGAPAQGRGGGGQADPWPTSKKLLAVADVQTGFHHDSISHALATVEQIGRRSDLPAHLVRRHPRQRERSSGLAPAVEILGMSK